MPAPRAPPAAAAEGRPARALRPLPAQVGDALHAVLSAGLVPRHELYICGKVWNNDHSAPRVRQACLRSLKVRCGGGLHPGCCSAAAWTWPRPSRALLLVHPPAGRP